MFKTQFILRWAARLASLGVIVLLLQFIVGEDFSRVTTRELVGLLFFPLGVVIGFVLSWWREIWGAALAALSLLGFYLIFGLLLTGKFPGGPWFLIFTSPALLFFASWVWGRMQGEKMNA
jgi:hypothetical protein